MEIVHEDIMKTCIVFLQRLSPTDILNMSKKINEVENMSVRRRSRPDLVKKLWTCIKTIKDQRQLPTQERVLQHMTQNYEITEDETLIQLKYCVDEGLIRFTQCNGTKGLNTDVAQEVYRLPKDKLAQDSHDWYCWKCHKPGEVVTCSRCFRVYHLDCIKNVEDITDKFVCEVCFDIFNDESDIPRKELNSLVKFSCLRLMQILVVKSPKENTVLPEPDCSSDYESDSESSSEQLIDLSNDDWHIDFLNFKYVDLKMMENKLMENKYVNLEEFRVDAEIIYHNTVILFGADSIEAKSVLYMVDECRHDVKEIRLCKDCFRESNLRRSKDWFCIPCKPPHQLVYAKQKGYSFWPAKVLKKDNDNYDVRFFGGSHTRAIVPEKSIRSIKECIFKLVKRNESWNKAYFELLRHQEKLLNDNDNVGIVLPNYILKSIKMIKGKNISIRNGKETSLNRSFSSKKKSKRNNQVRSKRSRSLHYIQPNSRMQRQKHNSCCSSNDDNSEPVPSLHCSESVQSTNGSYVTTFTKNKNGADEENSSKRFKKGRGLQASRPGLNVKTFDPNALQEEMGKFLLEDVHELCLTEVPTQLENNIIPNLNETSFPSTSTPPELEKENLDIIVKISDQESSHSQDTIPKLEKVHGIKNSNEVRYLRTKIAKQRARYEREIKKLKRVIINQKIRHKRKIQKIKKQVWCQECDKRASYYCCFNTSYCSITCQRKHWRNHRGFCQHKNRK